MSNQAIPPHVQVIQMGTAYIGSVVVYAAAEIGIADHLAAPQSAAELATMLGLHAGALHRLMRTMAMMGLLTEQPGEAQRFALTPLGAALKSDDPGCARSTMRIAAGPLFTNSFSHIVSCLETGKPGFDKAHGMPIFEYFGANPAVASMFSETMVGFHGGEPPAVAEAYDFSVFDTIVDVGGATGNLLAHILQKHPKPKGVLFDTPHVVAEAKTLLDAKGVTDRVKVESGSFWEGVPAGGDAYVLSHIVHDWNEEQIHTILGHVRKAMKPTGRLLIVEMVLPEGDVPHLGKMTDMIMLAIPGGEERTPAEYTPLLAKAGFRINRIVPTASPVSIIEALPA
jgi:hypothetical protein